MNILNTNTSNLKDATQQLLTQKKIEEIKNFRIKNAKQALSDQWSDIYVLKLQPPPGWSRYSIWISTVVIIVFICWAALFDLDEVTTGSGKVVPLSREQIVQSLEPGVVSEILVKEGQLVDINQALVRIDDVRIGSNLQEVKARVNAMEASAIRLRAESLGRKQISLNDFKGVNTEQVNNEINTFNAKKRSLESSLNTLYQAYKLNQEELKITEPLAAKGLVSDFFDHFAGAFCVFQLFLPGFALLNRGW